MDRKQPSTRLIIYLATIILQLLLTQVVAFVISLFYPIPEDFPRTHSATFAFIFGITVVAGVFLGGWLAVKLKWLPVIPKHWVQLAGTIAGAYLPLLVALAIFRSLEPGNLAFWFSLLGGMLGYYLPVFIKGK